MSQTCGALISLPFVAVFFRFCCFVVARLFTTNFFYFPSYFFDVIIIDGGTVNELTHKHATSSCFWLAYRASNTVEQKEKKYSCSNEVHVFCGESKISKCMCQKVKHEYLNYNSLTRESLSRPIYSVTIDFSLRLFVHSFHRMK